MTVAETIKLIDGIQDPEGDLNLTMDEYDSLIDYYISAIEDWFNYYMNKEYETLPPGLEQILIEMVANIIRNQTLRQDTPIMDAEETTTQQRIEQVVTEDIRLRLKPYIKKTRIGVMGIGTQTQYDTLMDIEDEDDIDDVE